MCSWFSFMSATLTPRLVPSAADGTYSNARGAFSNHATNANLNYRIGGIVRQFYRRKLQHCPQRLYIKVEFDCHEICVLLSARSSRVPAFYFGGFSGENEPSSRRCKMFSRMPLVLLGLGQFLLAPRAAFVRCKNHEPSQCAERFTGYRTTSLIQTDHIDC